MNEIFRNVMDFTSMYKERYFDIGLKKDELTQEVIDTRRLEDCERVPLIRKKALLKNFKSVRVKYQV